MKHAWMQSDRDYVVRASVTDMKGASASKIQVVAVGHPHAERLVGTIACDGKPVQDVRLNIEPAEPGSNTTTTDSDGNFALVGLERRQYLLRMYKAGYAMLGGKITLPAGR